MARGLNRIDTHLPLRQGFPKLKPMPLHSWLVAPGTEEAMGWEVLKDLVLKVLEEYVKEDYTISVLDRRCNRQSGPNTGNENLTILIVSKRDLNSDAWYRALQELESQFSKRDVSGITVEIIDPEAFLIYGPQFHHALEANDPIISAWPSIKPRILELLDNLPWATLSAVRRGPRQRPERTTTVLVGAPEDTQTSWSSITDGIQQILIDVGLTDNKALVVPVSDPFSGTRPGFRGEGNLIVLKMDEFEGKVPMGASFAPKGLEMSATIGGALRLRKNDGKVATVLMSVFHPFRTIVDQSTLINGMKPFKGPNNIRVLMPSTADAESTLESYEGLLDTWTDRLEDAKEKLKWTGEDYLAERFRSFEDKANNATTCIGKIHNLDRDAGELFACSGFQGRLDWSLITAPQRKVDNTLPNSEEIIRFTSQFGPVSTTVEDYCMENVSAGSQVIKIGRTTAITHGIINMLRTVVIYYAMGKKVEFDAWHIASPQDHDFSKPGDSGSWVVDMKGRWIGMIFAGIDGAGLMIPVDELVADIEKYTEAKVELA